MYIDPRITYLALALVIIAHRLTAHQIAIRYPSTVVSALSDLSPFRYCCCRLQLNYRCPCRLNCLRHSRN